jgi:hypothetical protein
VDERLNENRFPLHSLLREIQETDCGDLADLTILGAALQADGEYEVRSHGLRHRLPSCDSEEKHEPVSDIDTEAVDTLKAA